MNTFDLYAQYYDSLNQSKNYLNEADFIRNLIKKSNDSARSILELGCGTGIHAQCFASQGYSVVGLDMSEKMLKCARSRSQDAAIRPEFIQGDVRSFRLGKKFPIIVSLFHVLSYQTKNKDVRDMFRSVAEHLEPDGIFIFDFWYAPAVIHLRPDARVRKFENDDISIRRLATPNWKQELNVVDVEFSIFIHDKRSSEVGEIQEVHPMRYFSLPEIEEFANRAGLMVTQSGEWLKTSVPDLNSWNAYCIAKLA